MDSLEHAKFDQARRIVNEHKVPACLTMLLGNCIGHLSDCGLNRNEIDHVLDFLADGVQKIKNDPKALEAIKAMQSAVVHSL